jgi:hypothetical protein
MSTGDASTMYPRLLKSHLKAQKGKPATIVGKISKVLSG